MDILRNINTIDFGVMGLNSAIKALFLVIIVGYVIYALLLTLRVRILSDTVKTPTSGTARLFSYLHLLIAIIGSFLAAILILVG